MIIFPLLTCLMGRFLFSPPLWGSIRVSLETEHSTFIGSYWSRQCPMLSNLLHFLIVCFEPKLSIEGGGGVALAQFDMSGLSHSIWLAYNLARRLFWMHCKLMDKDWNFWQSFLGGSYLSTSSGRPSVSWTSEIVDSTSLQYDTIVRVPPRPLKAWNCLG